MLVKFGTNTTVFAPTASAPSKIPQQEAAQISLASRPDSVHFGRTLGAIMVYETRQAQVDAALDKSHEGITGADYLLEFRFEGDIPESWLDTEPKRSIVQGLIDAGLITINRSSEAELTALGEWVIPNVIGKKRSEEFAGLLDELVIEGRSEGRFPRHEIRGRHLLTTLKTQPIKVTEHPGWLVADEYDHPYGQGSNEFHLGAGNGVQAMNAFLSGLAKRGLLEHSQPGINQNEYRITPRGRLFIEWLGL